MFDDISTHPDTINFTGISQLSKLRNRNDFVPEISRVFRETSPWHCAVISARKAKKRSGFKGKPAWKKKAEKSVPKFVFVADSDVGEEDDEPEKGNPISASKRKLSYSESDEENSLNEVANAEGYRLVFMDSLRDIAQRIHGFSGCEGKVSVVEDPSKCFGLCSSLFIQCDSCDLNEFFSTGKHSLSDLAPRTMQGRDVNRRSVFAANEVGLRREGNSSHL
ncbi:uncharacterized protein LOC125560699 isoform X2 [Nematostella vectensis]|uniref:uncharacterized protein LOC125560699 isoform X2 n=1 Tax=Nematostella vectensis TaxID=45351 RepID=UPI00207736B0|nr:uncharacterized protein LOC125560699 isoform X2 [Nematostella vectensis]